MASIYDAIHGLFQRDIKTLEYKDKTYGSSWKRRGGVGAFMMLARKWDRLETLVKEDKYDIFETGVKNTGDILDDIADLRNYLFLVEAETLYLRSEVVRVSDSKVKGFMDEGSEAGRSYVNQD